MGGKAGLGLLSTHHCSLQLRLTERKVAEALSHFLVHSDVCLQKPEQAVNYLTALLQFWGGGGKESEFLGTYLLGT